MIKSYSQQIDNQLYSINNELEVNKLKIECPICGKYGYKQYINHKSHKNTKQHKKAKEHIKKMIFYSW